MPDFAYTHKWFEAFPRSQSQSGDSQSGQWRFFRSYSEVPYEFHGLESVELRAKSLAKVVVPGARRRVFYLYGHFCRTKFSAECWEALTRSGLPFFDNRKRWQVHADNPPPFKDGKDSMAWTITSFARVEHYCGKQRRT